MKTETQREQVDPDFPGFHGVFIGIGSNVGDRLTYCREAVLALGKVPSTHITAISSLYETDPVDYLDQGKFLNAVIEIETRLDPHVLLKHCQKIERDLGKAISIPKGPRTIDLDLLVYDTRVIRSPDLVLPHPAAAHRDFVLVPFLEIAPDYAKRPFPENIKTCLAKLDHSDLQHIQIKYPPGWERGLHD